MTATVGWRDALAWRMRRQYLSGAGASTVEDVVARLVTVPSWSGDAELAVGSRMSRPRPGAVAAAFTAGMLIKTFAFRGSMNYLDPSDAGVYLALRSAGRQWELKSWRAYYELEPADWPVLRAIVREALAARTLTQQELADVVVRDPRFSHLRGALTDKSCTFLKPFAWQGDLSLGAPRDGSLTLRSPSSSPGWSGAVEIDDAGPRAIRSYLAAYGPASAEHLQYWLGEGLSAGRRRIAGWITQMSGDEIVTITVGRDELLCRAEDADEVTTEQETGVLRLLPGLDPWVLGAGTSDEHIVPAARRREITRGANPVLIDGRVEGAWRTNGDRLAVTAFGDALPRDLLRTECARVSGTLGRDVELDLDLDLD